MILRKICQKLYLIIFFSLIFIYPVYSNEGFIDYKNAITEFSVVVAEESEFIEFHVENDSYFIKLPISELRKTELTLSENGISDENLSEVVEYILIQTFDSVREESWLGVNDTERFQFHVGYFIEYEIQGRKGI